MRILHLHLDLSLLQLVLNIVTIQLYLHEIYKQKISSQRLYVWSCLFVRMSVCLSQIFMLTMSCDVVRRRAM